MSAIPPFTLTIPRFSGSELGFRPILDPKAGKFRNRLPVAIAPHRMAAARSGRLSHSLRRDSDGKQKRALEFKDVAGFDCRPGAAVSLRGNCPLQGQQSRWRRIEDTRRAGFQPGKSLARRHHLMPSFLETTSSDPPTPTSISRGRRSSTRSATTSRLRRRSILLASPTTPNTWARCGYRMTRILLSANSRSRQSCWSTTPRTFKEFICGWALP